MSSIAPIDNPAVREAGSDLLSLALMDARNHTLHLLGRLEQALGPMLAVPDDALVVPPLWVAGHIGWFAEYWIARNPQRSLGAECPADGVRLGSIEPQADRWFHPGSASAAQRAALDLPALEAVKAYLLDTLETTLELLDKAGDGDAPLHFYRVALYHEDVRAEQLVVLAQTIGVALPLPLPGGTPPREPIALPATRWRLGFEGAGFAPAVERGSEEVAVPEFEIDSQPVTWSQFVEFIDDGGYDRNELWSAGGWHWLEGVARAEGRRGPRHVEQIGVASGAVLQNVLGRPTRMGALQPVMHVSWWEAEAFARWSGRRLPTEVEWEVAAQTAARRGFRWGDVAEWTAGSLRPFEGYRPDVWCATAELGPRPLFGRAKVVRGASFAARARMKYPKARRWALPESDEGFTGFRTCAI
ncbi:MAG: SUMF1/EgtB/PvdO family nonheme iron enzyme [Burkholderiales bacterium]|nr:SUMF1/EgtB/PvdO family nonheme iron enzyme [Burkholderiales bacterium]